MKKITLVLAIVALVGISKVYAEDYIFSCVASNSVITDSSTLTAQINKSSVKIKGLTIINPTAQAQTVSVYKNATSTTAVSLVASFPVPATADYFYPLGSSIWLDSALGTADYLNVPYFAVRTSTSSNPVTVIVIYK